MLSLINSINLLLNFVLSVGKADFNLVDVFRHSFYIEYVRMSISCFRSIVLSFSLVNDILMIAYNSL